jgi:hypothetical protein
MKIHKKSKDVNCPICGKICKSRGLKSHLRLLHNIKIEVEVKEIDLSPNDLSKHNLSPDDSRKITKVVAKSINVVQNQKNEPFDLIKQQQIYDLWSKFNNLFFD